MRFFLLGLLLALPAFAELPTITCGEDTSGNFYQRAVLEEGIDDFIVTIRESNRPNGFVSHIKPADHQMYTMEFRIPKIHREPGKPPSPNCFFVQSNPILFSCDSGHVNPEFKLTAETTGIQQKFAITEFKVRATGTDRKILTGMDRTYVRGTIDILFEGKTEVGNGKSVLAFEKTYCSSGARKVPITRSTEKRQQMIRGLELE